MIRLHVFGACEKGQKKSALTVENEKGEANYLCTHGMEQEHISLPLYKSRNSVACSYINMNEKNKDGLIVTLRDNGERVASSKMSLMSHTTG